MSELFRREALETLAAPPVGRIVLHRTLPMWAMTGFAATVSFAIGSVLIAMTYTKRESIPGVIVTQEESVQLTAPTNGVLSRATVSDGAVVHKGDTLFTFTATKKTSLGTSPGTEIELNIRSRMSSLNEDLNRVAILSSADIASARTALAAMNEQRAALENQREALQSRLTSEQSQAGVHARLAEEGFESALMAQQKTDELNEVRIRVTENQRQISVVNAQIKEKLDAITDTRLREPGSEAQIRRQLLDAQSDLIGQETSREWSVTSPVDGMLTNINIAPGQDVPPGTLLAEILPINSGLQARLYASSKEIGFSRVGQKVKLRVDSFPYMKFGTVDGTINKISASPARLGDLANSTSKLAASPTFNGEPLYPIQVTLSKQFLDGGGGRFDLRSGMQVEAQVQLETRTLLEWLVEPLQAGRP